MKKLEWLTKEEIKRHVLEERYELTIGDDYQDKMVWS